MEKGKYNTIALPISQHARLKDIASKEHRTMAQQVMYWIEQYQQSQTDTKAS